MSPREFLYGIGQWHASGLELLNSSLGEPKIEYWAGLSVNTDRRDG